MGQYDDMATKAGKELADVIQEGLDKSDRFSDVMKEMFEAGGALKNLASVAKAAGLDTRLVAVQVLRGALNDVLAEDLSLDAPAQPGSQG